MEINFGHGSENGGRKSRDNKFVLKISSIVSREYRYLVIDIYISFCITFIITFIGFWILLRDDVVISKLLVRSLSVSMFHNLQGDPERSNKRHMKRV